MIRLDAVTKRYGDETAVRDVSLFISAEQTTVLIGPSGSGKSTLLRLMIGLTRPEAGTVTIQGIPLTDANVLSLRRRMGYVIQEGGLFPHLTGWDNVALMAQHLGWERDRIDARIEELTELVQLAPDRLAQYPSELSGGQRQRVSLMRALMLDPDVLLLDEPLGALDPMIRSDLQDDLRAIFRRLGKTVIFVTHDIGEAGFFGDHVVLLQDGAIEQQGKMSALVRDPASPFVTDFIQAQRAPLENLSDEGQG
ncbi:ABC transporter ATP-binding protein [Salinibacter sp. 10B]|uniref:ATP-binding cassette domain-containing protein n=1 Tax=Salinibacter sp. 10B TaxID=1923971 RepID=UPI000CF53F6B|nr:ABC transporter ATP-binding protein [Salinibacter sp. 10B]PQJ35122.1 ABC transporter ATP-binding protein [Salinibacter sp. 10B]